jgi:hypothetical protein
MMSRNPQTLEFRAEHGINPGYFCSVRAPTPQPAAANSCGTGKSWPGPREHVRLFIGRGKPGSSESCLTRRKRSQSQMNAATRKRDIHLVGSIGLASAEDVFRTASEIIGDRVRRMPDGETGVRSSWIHWNRPVFEANPALELDPTEKAAGRRLTSDAEGIRRWSGGPAHARGTPPPPRLRVRDGAMPDDIVFPPLGHGEHAKKSYRIFCRLRDEGVINAAMRFQVSLPTAAALMNGHVVPSHHGIVEVPLMHRLCDDVADICASIPHRDLAIQWDIPCEMAQWEGVRPAWFGDVKAGVVERLVRHAEAVPVSVQLGLHFCYGSYGGRHWMEPKDTANCVEVHNRVVDRITRPLNFIHLPVPIERDDDAYFAPLGELKRRPETELYLGLIHQRDGVDGTRRRIATAQRFVTDFGIATECGFGRRPPETIPGLLKLHAAI